jgi:hypothetical protein
VDDTLRIWPTGTVRGNGTIVANEVIADGRVAPGNSPGILTIDGDYTQNDTSTLEIEVGALTPGPGPPGNPDAGHDQVRVSGVVTLGGVYEFPIINGFVPQAGDEITFIETFDGGSVAADTQPRDASAPGLDAANPNLAFRVVATPGVGGNVKLEFVSETEIFYDGNAATNDWFVFGTDTNWNLNRDPNISDRTTVENLSLSPKLVVIDSNDPDTGAKPEVNQLVVGETDGNAIGPVTVAVESGFELKARSGDVTIGDQGTIELDAAQLTVPTSQKVDVRTGGSLTGNGTVKAGELVVSAGTLRPGITVGDLAVQGNYRQESGGTLAINFEGPSDGEFDTVDVAGEVRLGGTLRIDATILTTLTPDADIEIMAAGSLIADETFDNVEWIGNAAAASFFYPKYDYATGIVALSSQRDGNMNGDNNIFNGRDEDLFVFALMNGLDKWGSKCTECVGGVQPQHHGDFNHSGFVDFDDIPGFQALLASRGASPNALAEAFERYFNNVPEPSAVVLVFLGGLMARGIRMPRKKRENRVL